MEKNQGAVLEALEAVRRAVIAEFGLHPSRVVSHLVILNEL